MVVGKFCLSNYIKFISLTTPKSHGNLHGPCMQDELYMQYIDVHV